MGLARNIAIVAASAYAGISTSSANFGSDQNLYVLNVAHQSRIRQSDDIQQIRLFTASKPAQLTSFNIDVWRYDGSTWDRVATQNILSSLPTGSGIKTITLSPFLAAQEGDYVGFSWTGSGVPANFMTTISATSPGCYYKTTSPGTTNVNWAAESSLASYVPIEVGMQAPHVVTIGDSYASGYDTHRTYIETETNEDLDITYAWKVQQAKGWVGQNMGIYGQTTTQIEARFASDVVALDPLYAIINGGGNDIRDSIPQSTFEANMNDMIDACQAAGIIPIVLSLPPFTVSTTTQARLIDDFNDALMALCITQGVTFVDLVPTLGQFRAGGDPGNKWDIIPTYDSGDGVHLNDAGYTQVANLITAELP